MRARTGKDWQRWFDILDNAGSAEKNHHDITTYLTEEFKVLGWWSQMITVGYERSRGLRNKYQRHDGYSIGSSKVIDLPVAAVYRFWTQTKLRDKWLKGTAHINITQATLNKSMRISWLESKTVLEVNFYPKGPLKSQVTVQHNKLASEVEATRMKAYWKAQLTRMAATLSPNRIDKKSIK